MKQQSSETALEGSAKAKIAWEGPAEPGKARQSPGKARLSLGRSGRDLGGLDRA